MLTAPPDASRNQDSAAPTPITGTTDAGGADSGLVLLPSTGAVEFDTVHVLIGGELVKTTPSNLSAEDLRDLSMRGARPAGPPPATVSVGRAGTLPAATVVEVDRHVDINGNAELAKHRLKIGTELARRKVTLRLDGHLVHVVYNGVLAKTLPSPITADEHKKIRGARIAANQLPPQAPGPMSV